MKVFIRAAWTALMVVGLATVVSAQTTTASGQSTTSKSQGGEKTVEEAYLQETAETMMIKELSHADDRDGKLIALNYAKKAIDGGRKSDDVRASLEYLALENTQVVERSAGLGPVTNNFPDVRRQACEYLGEFPSQESKDTLVKVVMNSKIEEPMVLAEAVRSLGKIGINDNDEVVDAICNSLAHFTNVGDSEDRLAIYTCFAFQDLAEKNGGIKDMSLVTKTLLDFTKGSYVTPVKKLALQTLEKLAGYQTKSSSSDQKNGNSQASNSGSNATK